MIWLLRMDAAIHVCVLLKSLDHDRVILLINVKVIRDTSGGERQ